MGAADANDVGFLVAQLAKIRSGHGGEARFALHLAGDNQHGNGIGPRAEDSVQCVDASGTGGHVDHADISGDPGVGFGGHGAGLFVVVADELDAGFPAQGVVEMHRSASRDKEDVADTPIGKTAEDVIGDFFQAM